MPGELFIVYTNRRNHMSVPVYNCVKEVKMGPSLFFVRDQSEWTRNWPLPLMFKTDKTVHMYFCICTAYAKNTPWPYKIISAVLVQTIFLFCLLNIHKHVTLTQAGQSTSPNKNKNLNTSIPLSKTERYA